MKTSFPKRYSNSNYLFYMLLFSERNFLIGWFYSGYWFQVSNGHFHGRFELWQTVEHVVSTHVSLHCFQMMLFPGVCSYCAGPDANLARNRSFSTISSRTRGSQWLRTNMESLCPQKETCSHRWSLHWCWLAAGSISLSSSETPQWWSLRSS